MKNKQGVKLFIVLFLCTFFIFAFSHYGALAFNTIVNYTDTYDEGTRVGKVDLTGKSESEAMEAVDEQLTRWLNETVITIHYKENQVRLDNALFRFNVTDSVKTATNGQGNLMLVQFEKNSLEGTIQDLFPTIDTGSININKLEEDLLSSAQSLEPHQLEFRLDDYLADKELNEDVIVQQIKVDTNGVNFSKMLREISSFEIPAKSQFSMLQLFKEKDLSIESEEMLNTIAAGIYELILPTNFAIIERNIGNEKPENIPLGFEAKVDVQKNIDLIFANPNEIQYVIKIESMDNTLIFSLMGNSFLHKYVIVTKDKQSFKPKKIKQYNSLLKPNEKLIERKGKEGQSIKVIRETYDEKGALLRSEKISEDYYSPIPQIEVSGLLGKENVNASGLQQTEASDKNSQNMENSSTEQDNEGEAVGEIIEPNSDLWGKPNEQMK
ncbi:VanW family protein [Bacillus sp. S/N-304-OC-R1]|uniref:VanW family protein n=1 Tax=Bacillus sp. S/N-304-OC-R1 TaxID=2758034 RepID=UPI001C8EBA18|nr:VanW family protein [Bacillus sp. S/N-304-OC-R1]MBY0123967.1 VanW family protein [Bacillus sp. S/N-304-OC-R1]